MTKDIIDYILALSVVCSIAGAAMMVLSNYEEKPNRRLQKIGMWLYIPSIVAIFYMHYTITMQR